MIDLKNSFPMQNVIAHWSAKIKIDFELSRVNFQRKVPELAGVLSQRAFEL